MAETMCVDAYYLSMMDDVDSGDYSVLPIIADYLEEMGKDVANLRWAIREGKHPGKTKRTSGWPRYYWASPYRTGPNDDFQVTVLDFEVFENLSGGEKVIKKYDGEEMPGALYYHKLSDAFLALVRESQ